MFNMNTRIIVDSTTDLMPEVKGRVSVVPLTVHFGDEEYIDGVTIDHKSFYKKVSGDRRTPHHQPGHACGLHGRV